MNKDLLISIRVFAVLATIETGLAAINKWLVHIPTFYKW